MNLLSDMRLKWYDDTSLALDDRREIVEIFMDSIGVTRDVAVDMFEILLMAKADDIALTREEIKKQILDLREKRGVKDTKKGLTDRNIQIWLKFFRDIEFIERIGRRYVFKGNKKPSDVFIENTKPEIIDKTVDYVHRLLGELENRYDINKPANSK